MKIKTFTVNPFQMNSYLYYDKTSNEGVIIDPGFYYDYEKEDFLKFIDTNKILLKFLINTHGHIDHVLGNKFIMDNFKVTPYIHKDDLFLYDNVKSQGDLYGLPIDVQPPITNFITGETKIKIGITELYFLHTPGHSPGGICIIDYTEKNIFCGDLIFQSSIGRTDLPGGDYNILINSILNNLFINTEDDFILYPGHNEPTTIGTEKKYNPFLK